MAQENIRARGDTSERIPTSDGAVRELEKAEKAQQAGVPARQDRGQTANEPVISLGKARGGDSEEESADASEAPEDLQKRIGLGPDCGDAAQEERPEP